MRRNGLQSTSNESRADSFERQSMHQNADNGYPLQFARNRYTDNQQEFQLNQQYIQQSCQDSSAMMGNSFSKGMNELSYMPVMTNENNYSQHPVTGMAMENAVAGSLAGLCKVGQAIPESMVCYSTGSNNAMWASDTGSFQPQSYDNSFPMGGASFGGEMPIGTMTGLAPGATLGGMPGAGYTPYNFGGNVQ